MSATSHTASPAAPATPEKNDFIRQIVREDLASGKHTAIKTRFPPEPNGYLHIGHAKAICLDFGVAREFGGECNLRLDDTNPAKEDPEYVRAIQDDVHWLGFEWHDLRHASDYFEVFYLAAEKLIRQGDAFVCDLTADQVREYRGTLTEAGRNSPYRDRSVEENLDLFRRMRAGEFPDGARTLRAKIDMASGNINLRDPALYRIKHVEHQNTGNDWPIYPMYDFAHSLSDAVEGITHSLCTLEFEDHRPLYDWCVDKVDLAHSPDLVKPLTDKGLPFEASKPRQIEFSRLNFNFLVMSKRKLMALVNEGLVDGWDDPRMPSLQGIRRRGYTPSALRLMVDRVGISKQNSLLDISILEGALRDDLDAHAPRRMAVVDPLKLVLTNLPEGHEESLTFSNHPKDASQGERSIPVLARAVDRARGLRGSASAGLQAPHCRRRRAPARRRHHPLRRGGEGRRRPGHRIALHARSRIAPRHGRRQPQGQGHHPLGQREARGRCGDPSLRSAVPGARPRQRRRRQDLQGLPESGIATHRHGLCRARGG